jgi:translation initiation factor 5B
MDDVIYRQPIVSVLGHVDSGKCVSGDTNIMVDGVYVSAEELYHLIHRETSLNIMTYDPYNIRFFNAELLGGVCEYVDKLVKVVLYGDREIYVTPEHKFLLYRGDGLFEYVSAIELSEGDLVVGLGTGEGIDRPVPVNSETCLEWVDSFYLGFQCYPVLRKTILRGYYKVYDFGSTNRNFVAEDIVIHNTSLLDKIRGTAVQLREAGGITQHIGASLFPKDTLEAIAGDLLKRFKFELRVPGLLVIDTPGHEVFTNLRRRGGSAADIAILVVDINRGFEPQTHESIQILISRRVPFLIAANKVDLIPGWRSIDTLSIIESLGRQSDEVRIRLEERIAYIISALNTYKFDGDRFDRIKDFRKSVAIVPVSAKTGEGIKELLTILIGLVQRFMLDSLRIDLSKDGYGVVLEVSKEPGLGMVLKCIHLDGVVRVGDTLVTAGAQGVITSRVRSILMPAPLDEIRDPRHRFKHVEMSLPASGILISAPDIEGVYSGAPFYSLSKDTSVSNVADEVIREVESIKIDTEKIGVVVKADTLGSLEAIIGYISRNGIPIRKADVGPISKGDVIEADIVKEKDENRGAILAFNVDIYKDALELAEAKKIPIFSGKILYRIVEEYLAWVSEEEIRKRREEFDRLVKPGKILLLEGYVFRRSKPAIIGVRVLDGTIRQKYPLIRVDGKKVGRIHQIQDRGKNIQEAKKDMEVAISIREAVVGRDVHENDILYVDVPEEDVVRLLREFSDMLRGDELSVLREFVELKRKSNPAYARF